MSEVFFFSAAFVAVMVGTIVGFGSSTIFLPLALFFLEFKTALVLVAFFHLFVTLSRTIFFFKSVNKKLLLLFGLPSIAFSFFGASLVGLLGQELLKLLLGFFLIAYSISSLFLKEIVLPATPRNAILGGLFSGFIAGLIGTAGAIRSAFLSPFNLEKKAFIGTAGAIGLLTDLARIQVYVSGTLVQGSYYHYLPGILAIAVIGSFAGKKILEVPEQKTFRKIVFFAFGVIGIKFVFDGIVFFL